MEKKVIEGVVTIDNEYWIFETSNENYNSEVCIFIDEVLNRDTMQGEKFRITIEKLED